MAAPPAPPPSRPPSSIAAPPRTTRHYGRPGDNIHAIQMELAQSSHLAREEPDFALDPDRAEALRATLEPILQDLIDVARTLARTLA